MSKLTIRKEKDPVLRVKTAKIKDPLDPKIQELILSMFETMKMENGLGLAAPQVGESLKLCVIEEAGKQYVLINPKITNYSKESVILEEGCLSFPGQFFQIKRPEGVKVQYLDEKGKRSKLKARGILARAVQHELDHLDGILIVDRAGKQKINPKNVPTG